MASETVDPIDWSHPPPYTGQYPLSSTYCTVQCGLQITRLNAPTEMRACDLRNARPTHSWYKHSFGRNTRVVFRRLVRLGSFLACWRQANVTPIQKGPPSSVANYRPISITSVLSKVFERLVSFCLERFMERSGVFPTTQFTYRNGQGTCDALLCVSHTLQSAVESGQEAWIVQIDFSAAFDRVNHL